MTKAKNKIKYYTLQEFADYVGIAYRTAHKYAMNGTIKTVQFKMHDNTRYLVSEEERRDFMRRHNLDTWIRSL